MNSETVLDLALAVWTIVRIVGPWVLEHAPGVLGSA